MPLPGQTSGPSPADAATDVALTADLSWTAGTNAVTYDVYLGTDVNAVTLKRRALACLEAGVRYRANPVVRVEAVEAFLERGVTLELPCVEEREWASW